MNRQNSHPDSISKVALEHDEGHEKTAVEDESTPDQFGTNTIYSPEEKALVKRLDSFIMPIVFCMYVMNKLDQNAIANARLDNFEKDLGLKGNQFNVCVSVLYAGYTLIQIPSNMLMSSKRVRPSIWMSGWMMWVQVVLLLLF